MQVTRIATSRALDVLKRVGADEVGHKIMAQKAQMYYFALHDLSYVASAIVKQEALSVGAEYATPREQILYKGEKVGLLIANASQLKRLVAKLSAQDFGLKNLATYLKSHIKPPLDTQAKIMAIINVTPDSFYASSRKSSKEAIERIYELLEEGVAYIDIGAASSRPGSQNIIESCDEIARLGEVCAEVDSKQLYKKAQFSIDTYNPKTAEFALKSGFSIINDVSGFSDPDMARVNAAFGATAIIMHSRGTPETMQTLTQYDDFLGEIDTFFERKIDEVIHGGGKEIILDVGFGFAKNDAQNLALVNHLLHFKRFGYPLLLGASRKTTLGQITGKAVSERLASTLALHLIGVQNGANILRVHDSKEHSDMLKVYYALQESTLQQGIL
ncbi:MAG: dihydropteroate synthase [Helicobacter sp.]|uniref:dihydropteroate synthase n=1 Tax=Helicobacter sp. TaxID=218 RepID=UPI003752ECA2|nr:dihydropteroate synthase [Helicobacter sp.]